MELLIYPNLDFFYSNIHFRSNYLLFRGCHIFLHLPSIIFMDGTLRDSGHKTPVFPWTQDRNYSMGGQIDCYVKFHKRTSFPGKLFFFFLTRFAVMRPILGLGKALAIYPESHWAKAWEKKKNQTLCMVESLYQVNEHMWELLILQHLVLASVFFFLNIWKSGFRLKFGNAKTAAVCLNPTGACQAANSAETRKAEKQQGRLVAVLKHGSKATHKSACWAQAWVWKI